jgi:hypothetical protein
MPFVGGGAPSAPSVVCAAFDIGRRVTAAPVIVIAGHRMAYLFVREWERRQARVALPAGGWLGGYSLAGRHEISDGGKW